MSDAVTALLIVVGVLLLAAVRAWWWVRKERVLRRVGLDLHVEDTDGDARLHDERDQNGR